METFFITKPVDTGKTVPNPVQPEGTPLRVVAAADGRELKWSGTNAIPAIGDTVNVRINSFGPAVVKGYFLSHDYAGVMVKPEVAPGWFTKQLAGEIAAEWSGAPVPKWRKEGIICVFGAEFDVV